MNRKPEKKKEKEEENVISSRTEERQWEKEEGEHEILAKQKPYSAANEVGKEESQGRGPR